MKYMILSHWAEQPDNAIEALEQEIAEYLKLGWLPAGGVSIIQDFVYRTRFSGNNGYLVAQAVTHSGDGRLPTDE